MSRAGVCEVNHCTVGGWGGSQCDPNSASVCPQSLLQRCNAALTAASVAPAGWRWQNDLHSGSSGGSEEHMAAGWHYLAGLIREVELGGDAGRLVRGCKVAMLLIKSLTFHRRVGSFPGLFWCEFAALPGLLPPAPANKLLFDSWKSNNVHLFIFFNGCDA